MILCKHCGSSKIVKNKQRSSCMECNKTFRSGDDREKYPNEKKIKTVKLYTEWMGLRSIERLESISSSLHWIRSFSKMIREKM